MEMWRFFGVYNKSVKKIKGYNYGNWVYGVYYGAGFK